MFEAHKEAKTFAESFMRLENEDLRKRLAALRSENEELMTQHRTEYCEAAEYDCVELGRLRDSLSRMEAERDALRDSVADFIVENADCLKIAIDTQDRHYLEVLIAQWRSAQWEG